MGQKIAIVIIHGIGINRADFADDLIKGIKTEFNNQVTLTTKEHRDYAQDLDFRPVVWDDLFAPHQKRLSALINNNLQKLARPLDGKVLQKVAAFLYQLAYFQLKSGIAAQFITDIISYGDLKARDLIFQKVNRSLEGINLQSNGKMPITLITHSLGTVIGYDFIRTRLEHGVFHPKLELNNFFTMGSPIALFTLDYTKTDLFKECIQLENPAARWVNILDPDDPVAYRLEHFDVYKSKMKDREVELGGLLDSHVKYWGNPDVYRIIGHKLALDWLRINNKISEAEFNQKLFLYDQGQGNAHA